MSTKITPQLRFPEFTDEWQMKKLGDIFEFKRTNSLSRAQLSEDGKVGNIHYGDIHKSLPTLLDASKVKLPMIVSSKQFNTADAIKVGDVILADASEDYADIGKAIEVVNLNHGQEVYSGLHTFLMRPAYPSAHGFNGMLFKTATIRKQLMRIATGISVLGVSKNNVSQLVVATPSKPEQEKIADFLTAVDERIAVGEKKLELLETYKRGVMQKIFTQQIRFKDENGSPYPDWEEKKLKHVLKIRGERNSKKETNEVFSVAKNAGVINQIEHLGRSFASKEISNYKVVRPGDIIYTKSPTSDFPYGIIKQNMTNRTGVVSVLYGVYEPVNIYTGRILDGYFKSWQNTYNYLNPIVQKGAKNTINIGDAGFLEGRTMNLPVSEDEQQKIATFLATLDDKITAEKSKLTAAKKWKKGLLQRMFV